jgi:hypothetical protein
MVVIFKAGIEHGVSLGLSHAVEFAFVVIAKTDVLHYFSPLLFPSGWVSQGRCFPLARSHFQLLC